MKTTIRSERARNRNPNSKRVFTLVKLSVLVVIAVMALALSAAEPPGSVDLSFNAGELTGSVPQVSDWTVIEDMALLPDGRLYIGGHLTSVQGVSRDGIARLLPSGVLDPTFQEHQPNDLLGGDTHQLLLESDANILAGYYCFRRFRANGAVDGSLTNCPNVITVQPDGKLLVVSKETPTRSFRLFPDGSTDPSFSTTVEVDYLEPRRTLVEADGRILIVTLNSNRAATLRELVRLLANGEMDASFRSVKIDDGVSARISALARQSDGKYLVAGRFLSVNGVPRTGIARLLADGTVDGSFDAKDAFLTSTILAVAIQPDGRILVGGHLFNRQSTSMGGLVRLNADGSLDASFSVGTGAWHRHTTEQDGPDRLGFVKRIVLQPDGRILVSGEFNEFGGVARQYIVRLQGDSPEFRLNSLLRLPDGRVQMSVADFTGRTTVVEAATELAPPNWRPIWTNTVSGGSFTVTDVDPSSSPRRYYRALAH